MEGVESDDDGEPADELGDEAVLHQVVSVDVLPDLVIGAGAPLSDSDPRIESDALTVFERTLFDDLVHTLESAAAHEEDVVGAYL